MTTKADLITSIATLAGVPDPGPGIGSSVYKKLFVAACTKCGFSPNGTMPELAERIVRRAGLPYDLNRYDSRRSPSGGGSTVTLEGLEAVERALQKLLR